MPDSHPAELRNKLLARLVSGEIDKPTYDLLLAEVERHASAPAGSDTSRPGVKRDTPVPSAAAAPPDDSRRFASIGGWTTAGPARAGLSPGAMLGAFRIESQLGRGGMGEVWKAFDEIGERHVVIKVLPQELQHSAEELDRVKATFRHVHALNHQYICPTYMLGRDDRVGYYLVMKFVVGATLVSYRKKYAQAHGAFGVGEAVRVLTAVAQALDYAHHNKIVHRDVKPENVMISDDGQTLQVVDFGLAAEIRSSMTRVSQVRMDTVGTYPYMAPEQWKGEFQDGRADQYALAVMAYELIAGRPPFYAADAFVLRQCALLEPPPPIENIPPFAWSALQKALAKTREERFASCVEFVEALSGGKEGGGKEAGANKDSAGGARATSDADKVSEWGKLRQMFRQLVGNLSPSPGSTSPVSTSQGSSSHESPAEADARAAAGGDSARVAPVVHVEPSAGAKARRDSAGGEVEKPAPASGESPPAPPRKVVPPPVKAPPAKAAALPPPIGPREAALLEAPPDRATLTMQLNAYRAALHTGQTRHFGKQHGESAWRAWQAGARLNWPEAQFLSGLRHWHGWGQPRDAAAAGALFEAASKTLPLALAHWGECLLEGAGGAANAARAVECFHRAARQGESWGDIQLAHCLRLGLGARQDLGMAAGLLHQTAQAGSAEAEFRRGRNFLSPLGGPPNHEEAFFSFREAAERGHPGGMAWLGVCHLSGWGAPKNIAVAVQCFQQAAAGGDTEGLTRLATCHLHGWGLPANPKAAIPLFAEAAAAGHPDAQTLLGLCFKRGTGVAVDARQAAHWLELAAAQGDAMGQYQFAECLHAGEGRRRDFALAAHWYAQAARQSQVDAMARLGVCYFLGEGVMRDDPEALRWLTAAAEQNHPVAQYHLGLCHQDGRGVAASAVQAARCFALAARQDHAAALCALGHCHLEGRGVARDETLAFQCFEQAARQGHTPAKIMLGKCLLEGRGSIVDARRAGALFYELAQQGHSAGQYHTGLLFLDGRGGLVNLAEAMRWLTLAAQQGYAPAQTRLGECLLRGVGASVNVPAAITWLEAAARQNEPAAHPLLEEARRRV